MEPELIVTVALGVSEPTEQTQLAPKATVGQRTHLPHATADQEPHALRSHELLVAL